jgi:hypothetical protein
MLSALSVITLMVGCEASHNNRPTYNVTVTATATNTPSGYQGPTTQTATFKAVVNL